MRPKLAAAALAKRPEKPHWQQQMFEIDNWCLCEAEAAAAVQAAKFRHIAAKFSRLICPCKTLLDC
ncbi:hypothetical protein METH_00725 [Leisingera methylohalidivorans DSM 14336]|uniref:Uncharacterized protein n=1 Tax=Leisingera methylohalidivorans DSM 14336 TaxID=999552 RepID=V9VZM9_9RHOB|nr:hypothetical protein METH_00725 [Leisingera methylohalidivorans DSM 14336]